VPDAHETEVTGAKIFHVSETKKEIQIVSAEMTGKVKTIEIKDQGFFRGTTYTKTALYEKRLKTTVTVCVHKCPERFQNGHWDEKRLVAFGATSEVVVVSMKPIKEVIRIRRPNMCRLKTVPYLDFGFGLTPGKQEYSVPILAIAWDNLVQLVYFDELAGNEVKMDGFYVAEQEISSCYFMGHSTLMILVD
jgi:hypothetical protein